MSQSLSREAVAVAVAVAVASRSCRCLPLFADCSTVRVCAWRLFDLFAIYALGLPAVKSLANTGGEHFSFNHIRAST